MAPENPTQHPRTRRKTEDVTEDRIAKIAERDEEEIR